MNLKKIYNNIEPSTVFFVLAFVFFVIAFFNPESSQIVHYGLLALIGLGFKKIGH